jgi:hypothetical protein
MSVIRTFTVTVSDPGSGNRYYIDGVLQDTVVLAEGYTYKFDVSDSSVSGHPFKFSTTSNGTHSGGSEYTTGVTTSGNAGDSGAYVQIAVAASAPQLYYYCQYHSGMGGAANTVDSNTWGVLEWNQNSWGDQDGFNLTLSGLSATTSLGNFSSVGSEQGWGSDPYGVESWGESGNTILLSGLQATASVGVPAAGADQGWGRTLWGEEPWGDSDNPVVTLPSFALTSSLNTPTDFIEVRPGWGTLNWGENGWGTVDSAVFNLTGLSATATVGSLTVADQAVGLTGLSINANVGTPTTTQLSVAALTGVSATSSVGSLTVSNQVIGLTGLAATSAVGSLTPADVMGLTGLSAQTTLGEVAITSNPVTVLTGVSATSSLGSITLSFVTEAALTGVSATSALGSVTTTQASGASLVGLGQTATTTLNDTGIILRYFNRLVPKDSTGYSRKTPKDSTGYTRKTAN